MGHVDGEGAPKTLVEEYLEKVRSEISERSKDTETFQDLADHGKQGRPYKILTDEVVGRHMVAVRNIKAGEVGIDSFLVV